MAYNDETGHNNKELYGRMQKDIDALLSSIGDAFDELAEYHDADRDPINHLDIDQILQNNNGASFESYEIDVVRRKFPKHPKRIVNAMPKVVQTLMRDVSFVTMTDSGNSKKSSRLRNLFQRKSH
jgi:hypothetical protein